MKIGLLDADLMDGGTRHPNLALMKIAGYYKDLGHDVKLIYDNYLETSSYDKVFISKVFTFSKIPKWVIDQPNVQIGGTGFYEDGGSNLPMEIEHHMPYYDLYLEYVNNQIANGRKRSYYADYLDYSIGFATRGCFRKCSFCVNKKYSRVHRHSQISEFVDTSRKYIYLWDDNILAYAHWEEILDELIATGKPFQFRQGMDIRLMTDKKAKKLSECKYKGDFIFAFDDLKDRDRITKKLMIWKKYNHEPAKLYVLCAYKSQDINDVVETFERIKILMEYGCLPYIMRYESYENSPFRGIYISLARWCNQPSMFKKKSFREWADLVQTSIKTNKTCAPIKYLTEFESQYPEIASKYFDLKFEEVRK